MKKILALSAVLASLSTQAAVVLSDSFNYPNGAIVNAPGTIWQAHSGAGSFVMVTNNVLIVSRSRNEDINAALSGAPYLDTDPNVKLYSSYTLAITNDLPTLAGGYFSHFRGTNVDAATDFGARVWLSLSNSITGAPVPAGRFRIGIANGTAGGDPALRGQVDLDLSTGVVYQVVTRFVPSTGIATIWVDPTAEESPSATATDPGTVARPNPFPVFTYAFRQAGGIGTVFVDDLKIGTSFSDVAGANTAPTVSAILTQSIPAGGVAGPLAFVIGDAETPNSLTVTADSSNTSLVPDANVVLGGAGVNRTVTVTPIAGQQGEATVTIRVSDGVNTTTMPFLVRVGAPTISLIADQSTPTNTPTALIPFTVGDGETPGNLNVTGSSSNPSLVADNQIVISGVGANRTVKITPQVDVAGFSTITLRVSDGTLTTATSFSLNVYPKLGLLFSNSFPYPDGLVNVGSAGIWTAHSSADSNDCYVVSEQLLLSRTNAMDVSAYFNNFQAINPSSFVVLYTKFTIQFTELPRFDGAYFAHVRDTGTSNFRARVYATTNGAAAGSYRLGIANTSATISAMLPQDLSLGTTYTVVTRYNVASGRTTIWVNPRYESDPAVTAADTANGIDVYTYAFRQDGNLGTVLVDDLLIGTSFEDVIPFVPSPSPIPLAATRVGDQLVLTWSNPAFTLQRAGSLGGSFTNVPNATSPYTTPLNGEGYFRLKY